jgi:mono/diheme cytochrome c family protein
VLSGLLVACEGPVPRPQHSDNQDLTQVERGRYLATVGDCTACHTGSGGKFLAGGRPIATPLGSIVSPNITPDKDTGIGAMSDEQYYNAMHTGVSDKHLYPVMPYPYYTKVTREDVTAIRAWLDTVPPVVNRVHADTLPFPLNIRANMIGWNALFFQPGDWRNRPDRSVEWNRGGYLVEGLGHCGACHTPKNILAGDENSRHLQGYAMQGWFAPNITNDAHAGLGTWSADDAVEYLRTGTNRFTSATGLMAEAIEASTSHWAIDDLRAAVTYLKDQPGGGATPGARRAGSGDAVRSGDLRR